VLLLGGGVHDEGRTGRYNPIHFPPLEALLRASHVGVFEGRSIGKTVWRTALLYGPGGGPPKKKRKQPPEDRGGQRVPDFSGILENRNQDVGYIAISPPYAAFPISGRKIFDKLPECNLFVRIE
jgi:hypothetical protein